MTHDASPAAPAAALPGRQTVPSHARTTGRLLGIDLARGLAVFGMYSAHVGPDVTVGGPVGFLLETARGRSSALFAGSSWSSSPVVPGPGPAVPAGRRRSGS